MEPRRAFDDPAQPILLFVVFTCSRPGCSVSPVFMELNGAQFVHEQPNVFVVKDADFSPLRQTDPEGDLRRLVIRCDLNHGRHTARIFTSGRRVDLLSEQFLAKLLNELICFHGLLSRSAFKVEGEDSL